MRSCLSMPASCHFLNARHTEALTAGAQNRSRRHESEHQHLHDLVQQRCAALEGWAAQQLHGRGVQGVASARACLACIKETHLLLQCGANTPVHGQQDSWKIQLSLPPRRTRLVQ